MKDTPYKKDLFIQNARFLPCSTLHVLYKHLSLFIDLLGFICQNEGV